MKYLRVRSHWKLRKEKLTFVVTIVSDITKTRMHSSRMRTVRSSSRLPGEGVSAPVHAAICLPGGGGGVCVDTVDTVEGVCNGFLPYTRFLGFLEFSGYHQWQQESQ